MKLKKKFLKKFKLYVLINFLPTNDEEKTLQFVCDIIKRGADIIQLRVENRTDKEFLSVAYKIKRRTSDFKIPFIVNNRPDIALLVNAEGIHLGQDDLPIESVKKIAPQKFIGKSTHNLDQALKAEEEGADYISIGPIFSSPTKPNLSFVGLNLLEQVNKRVSSPILAIGGINLSNVKEVIKAGAKSVAVCSAISKADNPGEITQKFKNLLTI